MKDSNNLLDFSVLYKITGEKAYFPKPYITPVKNGSAVQETFPVITPASVISIVERVYWKPEYEVVVKSIKILNAIQKEVVSNRVSYIEKAGEKNRVISSYISKKTNTKELDLPPELKSKVEILKDVSYVVEVCYKNKSESNKSVGKHKDAISYRCKNKNYFEKPTLGCSAFAADVTLATGFEVPLDLTFTIPNMTHTFQYGEDYDSVRTYHAECNHGVIRVPEM